MFPLPLTEKKLLFDNSALQELCTCPRKHFYKYVLQRQKVQPRAALFFGAAVHKALEVRDRLCQGIITADVEDKMIEALIEYYTDVDMDGDYRSLTYAIDTIKHYNIAWKFDPHPPLSKSDGTLLVEVPFALSIGRISTLPMLCCDRNNPSAPTWQQQEFEVVFTGKVDRVVTHNGATYLLDHKTTSILSSRFFEEYYTALQFRGYKFAMEYLLGKPISGVFINCLVCRPPLKSGQVNYTFDRQPIPISNSLIPEWKMTFITLVHTFLTYLQRAQQQEDLLHIPIYTGSCNSKFGACEYADVCSLPVGHRDSMLYSKLFESHTWSPLDKVEKPKAPEIDLATISLWD